jgi:D-alanyl-D-alanine carboxypeptidase
MRLGRLLFAAVALLFTTMLPITAQQAGTISGRVTDQENGAGLAGASVEAKTGSGRVVAVGSAE